MLIVPKISPDSLINLKLSNEVINIFVERMQDINISLTSNVQDMYEVFMIIKYMLRFLTSKNDDSESIIESLSTEKKKDLI
jgi:hypothetical protein